MFSMEVRDYELVPDKREREFEQIERAIRRQGLHFARHTTNAL